MSSPGDETGLDGPYPLAARMREAGKSDAEIRAALGRLGVSERDVTFILGSLPGGALDVPGGQAELTRPTSERALERPIPGWVWMFGGGLGAIVNHGLEGPVAVYVLAGGAAFVGLLLAFRGR